MTLRNAFETLATEAKQDDVIVALLDVLTELGTKLDEGGTVELGASTLAGLEQVTVANPTADPETGLAKETTLAEILGQVKDGTADTVLSVLQVVRDTLATRLAEGGTVALDGVTVAALTDVTVTNDVPLPAGQLSTLTPQKDALTDAELRAAAIKAVLQVGGADVTGSNPLPTTALFADQQGVPYDENNRVPVDVGGTIQIDNMTVTFDSVVSTQNSTDTPLLADEVFTGAWEDVTDYSSVVAVIFTDAASATNGAVAQFSADGTDVVHQAAATVPAGVPVYFSFPPVARYFRIVYTNGPAAQTTLEAQITYKHNPVQLPITPLGGQFDDSDNVVPTKSALHGKVMSGPYAGLYLPVAVTEAGTMQTSALTDAELRANPVPVADEDTALEVLGDQAGDGTPLTFTFTGGAAQPWVSVDTGAPVRVTTTQTPTGSLGIPVPAGSPFPIPVTTDSLQVLAAAEQTVTVYGTR